MPQINVVLPRPHAGQQRAFAEHRRFSTICCGRRWGKSVAAINRLVLPALEGQPVAYFLPSYPMMAEVWRSVVAVCAPVTLRRDASAHRLELITGGVIDMWSLQNPDAVRGRRYKRAIIDEAAMIPNLLDAWNTVIRPTLTDFKGDAFFLSTPKGRNDFYTLFQRGISNEPGWSALSMPTVSNPFIDPEEVEAARRDVPELVFAQEYLATFIADNQGLFRKVMQSAVATEQTTPERNHSYVMGVDWARSGDYTVISVVDATTMEQVYLDRFNQVDYDLQMGRLLALNDLFQPSVIVAEQNNMGGPLIEQLRGKLPIQSFVTTNASKKEIIDGLSLSFEAGTFRILNNPIQIGELLAFEQTRLPSGLWRYAAAGNGHDDTVIALALSHHAAQRPDASSLVGWA